MNIRNKLWSIIIILLIICISSATYGESIESYVYEEYIYNIDSDLRNLFTNDRSIISSKNLISINSNIETVYSLNQLRTEIYNNISNYEESFSINYQGDTNGLLDNILTLITSILYENHYIFGTLSNYGIQMYTYPNSSNIDFSFVYHTNKLQEEYVDNKVTEVIADIIEPGMNDFQKIRAINDYIVRNTTYSSNTSASPHAAYTLFREGNGVCQAYALATFRLLEKVGIPSIYVTGESKGVGHAWTMVELNGEWYHLDTTWNDPISNNGQDILTYKYFLITDQAILTDHTIDNRIDYPNATDDFYEIMRGITNPAEKDNVLYYANELDNIKLYKLDLDSMEVEKISDNRAQNIVIHDQWIYYSNYSNGGYLSKIMIDGTDNTQLNRYYSTKLYIDMPYLYFYNESHTKWESILIGEIIDVEEILLDNYEANLEVHETVQLKTSILPTNSTNKSLIWTSSNPQIATVDEEGIVTAISPGNVAIRVTTLYGSISAECQVIVRDLNKFKNYDLWTKTLITNDTNHSWTIEMNIPIDEDSITDLSVYIIDSYGLKQNYIAPIVSNAGELGCIELVNTGSFKINEDYIIIIEDSIRSLSGIYLDKGLKIDFRVE